MLDLFQFDHDSTSSRHYRDARTAAPHATLHRSRIALGAAARPEARLCRSVGIWPASTRICPSPSGYPRLRLCTRNSRVHAKGTLALRTNNAVLFFITVLSSLYSTFLTRSNDSGASCWLVMSPKASVRALKKLGAVTFWVFSARCVQDVRG